MGVHQSLEMGKARFILPVNENANATNNFDNTNLQQIICNSFPVLNSCKILAGKLEPCCQNSAVLSECSAFTGSMDEA